TPTDGGRPLPDRLRQSFESRLGRDLGGTRLHLDDPRPAKLRAAAYTIGRDIVLGPGQYRPETKSGRRLLAHELTHVAQQESASGRATLGPAADGFEREAERAATSLADPAAAAPVQVTPRAQPALQRRLLMDGDPADIDGLLGIIRPPSGLLLRRNPPSAEIDFAGA